MVNTFGEENCFNRRTFLQGSTALVAGLSAGAGALFLPETARAADSSPNVLGPQPGYSPQVGTLVSMLTWMREANGVIRATDGVTMANLDYLFDKNANTIGALMLHLAATETYYQLNTFDGKKTSSSWRFTAMARESSAVCTASRAVMITGFLPALRA